MNPIVVNISDMKIATNSEDVLATYSLGSCLGVTVYDPQVQVGGMIHCLLGRASAARERAKQNPYMFVTTGVPLMVRKLVQKGAVIDRMVFKAAGGANMRRDNIFRTGEQNYMALQRLLERNDIALSAAAVGGDIPRSMYLHLDTGQVFIKTFGETSEL